MMSFRKVISLKLGPLSKKEKSSSFLGKVTAYLDFAAGWSVMKSAPSWFPVLPVIQLLLFLFSTFPFKRKGLSKNISDLALLWQI